MNSHATSIAALFQGAGKPFDICSVERHQPRGGEALVQIECSTICGSDLHTYAGKRIEATPTVLGHESIGIITEAPTALSDFYGKQLRVGDRITWTVAASCGGCRRCVRGYPQKCLHALKYGHLQAEGRQTLTGGFAEHILLHQGTSLFRLRPDVPARVYCPANCATATIVACFDTAGKYSAGSNCDEKSILIFGAGMLGITAAAFAAFHGATDVVLVDTDSDRLHRSQAFGATQTVAWPSEKSDPEFILERLAEACEDIEFDIVLELSGAPAANQAALHAGAIGGSTILAGSVLPCSDLSLNPEHLIRSLGTIRGVHNYSPGHLGTAVQFLEVAHQHYPFEDLIEASFPLVEIDRAFAHMQTKKHIRVAIRP